MTLYLSSYKLDDKSKLGELFQSENKRVAVIANSRDWSTDLARRAAGTESEIIALSKQGLQGEELDLRLFFGKSEELERKLTNYAGVWVLGGNTFVLRRAFKASGFDKWLISQKENPYFIYAGYSAGACVLQKDLKDIAQMDEPNADAIGYPPEILFDGVGLINYEIVPHYMSPSHPESVQANSLVEYLVIGNIEHRALKDGEFIIETTHRQTESK